MVHVLLGVSRQEISKLDESVGEGPIFVGRFQNGIPQSWGGLKAHTSSEESHLSSYSKM